MDLTDKISCRQKLKILTNGQIRVYNISEANGDLKLGKNHAYFYPILALLWLQNYYTPLFGHLLKSTTSQLNWKARNAVYIMKENQTGQNKARKQAIY